MPPFLASRQGRVRACDKVLSACSVDLINFKNVIIVTHSTVQPLAASLVLPCGVRASSLPTMNVI